MADVVNAATRSRMMAGIRSKDTKPELLVRRALHARGFRYRLHRKGLPSRPDMVFPKYGAVVFVHGCFWHGHDCPLFRWPSTRPEFWRNKINANRERDAQSVAKLLGTDWRVGIVWECAIKGRLRRPVEEIADSCANWLISAQETLQVRGG